jgi:hypothetical protein
VSRRTLWKSARNELISELLEVVKARSIILVKLARTEPDVVDPVDAAPAPVGANVTPAAATAG